MDYRKRVTSPEEALSGIRRGGHVFIGSAAAEPLALTKSLAERAHLLSDNQIIHIRSLGVSAYAEPRFRDNVRYNTFFIGETVREAVAGGSADYTPIFLSEAPRLFRTGRAPIDTALIMVSPPDEHGFCSLGVSVDLVKSACECAREVVAEINPQMPRTLGDSFLHTSRIARFIENDAPLPEIVPDPGNDVSRRIGKHIADLVVDGATIQVGIGSIPDSVLNELQHHRDLGVHTEMLSDGILRLIECGAVTGTRKTLHAGKVITSFALGSKRLYSFVHDNPMFEFHPSDYSNDPFVISRNQNMTAINAALEVDLTGQVCSDSLGTALYSGFGGQVDFIRGAARSSGGKAIIALPSTVEIGGKRVSRIVSVLKPGAGVVTTRADVHFVVTEYGSADLFGRSLRERAIALIHLAHPDFRETLLREARERRFVLPDQVAVPNAGSPETETLATEHLARNGRTVLIRPILPADEELLQDLFYRSSEESIYRRFFMAKRSLHHAEAQYLVNVDYRSSLALVGVVTEGEREVVIAVGRYHRNGPEADSADCAFFVRDDWQDQGVGHHLVERLMDVANPQTLIRFTADVLVLNTAMLHLFHECARGPIESTMDGSSYRLSFPIVRT